ncbi:MAG: CHASE2 domain-containing protein [Blastocatellia bacterium]|nr:CHASE2 domain-containing protein [Blastocatellia bacterium]
MRVASQQIRYANRAVGVLAILLISAMGGMVASYRAPWLQLYVRDALMRARGTAPISDEIVIVAIDEASIARYGRFPWARSVMARALDRLAEAKPRAIALDVLYSDPSAESEDEALAASIARAGRVVAAAQLIETSGEQRATWLRPLPAIERAAAGIGHVNITTDRDGVARSLLLRQIDDASAPLWAMALEAVRVGEGAGAEIRELPEAVRVGARELPVSDDAGRPAMASEVRPPAQSGGSASEVIRAARMTIDYAGPAGAFASRTVSIADLLDGRVPAERFRDKYVLIGATVSAMSDRLASPFVGHETGDGNQHATLTPGVEILANSINTILLERFHTTTPDGLAFLCALLVSAGALAALALAQGRREGLASLAALSGLAALTLAAGYASYSRLRIEPPIVPMLAALLIAAPLTLLRRTLTAGAELDERIDELTNESHPIAPGAGLPLAGAPSPAPLIAQLTRAAAVVILARAENNRKAERFAIAARFGIPPAPASEKSLALQLDSAPHNSVNEALLRDEAAARYFPAEAAGHRVLTLRLGEPDAAGAAGALLLAYPPQHPPEPEALQLSREIAANWLATHATPAQPERGWFDRLPSPQGLKHKARTLASLQQRLLRRSRTIDRALHSVEDGLLMAGVDGVIQFANPRAGRIFGLSERALIGKSLFQTALNFPLFDSPREEAGARALRDSLTRLLIDRAPVEREITLEPEIGSVASRHYIVRIAPVCERPDGAGPVTGLVATLSDITRHYELQQMKNDVMALVTHELRTPITAIQGMSEVLAEHDFTADEQREMHTAINEEARRLARMIDEYLDIARLESGARPLRRESVRVTPLLERTLLMLEPIAAKREIRLVRRFAPNLPPVLADADLLARAVSNLVVNAIKYSPAGREVVIETSADERTVRVSVADTGPGIPPDSLDRIFEKFYRVPRLQADDAVGAGLGLAFVREVAEMHGGRVTVESELNVGSTFSLWLIRE